MKSFSNQIKLISFDLDNALYDNSQILINAEEKSAAFLENAFLQQQKKFDLDSLIKIKNQLKKSDPIKFENLSLWRKTAYHEFCKELSNSNQIVEDAYFLFISERSKINVPESIIKMLDYFHSKIPMVAVTNGNCQFQKTILGNYLEQGYTPDQGYRSKPHPEMLLQVMTDYQVKPSEVIHLGDSLEKDGGAAKAAGTHFIHLAPFADFKDIDRKEVDRTDLEQEQYIDQIIEQVIQF